MDRLTQWSATAQDVAAQQLAVFMSNTNNSALPAALLMLITPFYIYRLTRRQAFADAGSMVVTKAGILLLIATFELSTGILLYAEPDFFDEDIFYSPLVSVLADVFCIAISYTEYRFALWPSPLVSGYLATSLALDAHRAVTYVGNQKLEGFAIIAIPLIGFKLVLIALEEGPKWLETLPQRGPNGKPPRTGAMRYRERYRWLYATLLAVLLGAKEMDDIPDISSDFGSQMLYTKFASLWAKQNKPSKGSLARLCLWVMPSHFFFAALPRLCFSALSLTQPFLVYRVIQSLGGLDGDDYSTTQVFSCITLFVYLGIAVSKTYCVRLVNHTAMRLRGMLSAAVYKKGFNLARDQLSNNDIVTLLNADMDAIENLLTTFHETWSSALELGVGMYLLYIPIRAHLIWVLLPVAISLYLGSLLEKPQTVAKAKWNKERLHRVSATSTMLEQLTSLRSSGLTLVVLDYLEKLQDLEIKASISDRYLRIASRILVAFPENLVPPLAVAGAFCNSASTGNIINVDEAFAIFTTVGIMATPLRAIVRGPKSIRRGINAFQHIQDFLCLDEFRPFHRIEESETNDADTSEAIHYAIELVDVIVKFEDGTQWFDRLSVQFSPDQVSMLVGPTASGKSTLIKTILGELPLAEGHIITATKSIAYCGQTAWLQSASIHHNVVGRAKCDAPWYTTVVNACQLNHDIRELEDGDETLVGLGGCFLTEAQMQRIALARAVYRRPSVLLLDGTLNAMDGITAEKILDNLFGKSGILRESRVTVIMTTNISSDLAMADAVYFLDEDESMRQIDINHDQKSYDKHVFDCLRTRDEYQSPKSSLTYGVDAHDGTASIGEPARPVPSPYSSTYFDCVGWGGASLWFLLVGCATLLHRLPSLYARVYLDVGPGTVRIIQGVLMSGTAGFVLSILNLVFYYLVVVPSASRNIHHQLLEAVLSTTLWFTTVLDRGTVLQRFDDDLKKVASALPDVFMDIASASVTIPIDIVVLGVTTTFMAPFLPFMFMAVYITAFFHLTNYYAGKKLDQKARQNLLAHCSDTMVGARHIRAFNWGEKLEQDNMRFLDLSQRSRYFLLCNDQSLCFIMDLSIMGMATLMVALALFSPEACSKPALGFGFVALTFLNSRLPLFVDIANKLENPIGAMTRVQNFVIDTPFEVDNRKGSLFAQCVDRDWSSYGRLEFKSVNAPLNPADATSSLALSSIRLSVEAGMKIAITGHSGSGKSSLLLSLQNFFEYTGTITVDGRDIRGLPRQILRKNILTLTHQSVMFDGTLRHNLDPLDMTRSVASSRRIGDEYVIGLLERLRLWQHIETRGGTLDSLVSDLEMGPEQKQLVCIARLLLRKMQSRMCLVLLDCVTDNLDPETADAVEEVMADVFRSCTVLSVSRRPKATEKADAVVQMHAGRIIGTFAKGEPIDMDPYAFLKDLPWLSPSLRHRIRMAYNQ